MKLRMVAAGALAVGGSLCLALSALLLQSHFQLLKDMREFALPLAAELPPLEERLKTLGKQVELGELQAALRTDSAGEKLNVHVLPSEEKLDRLLAFFESARTFLERKSLLRSMSAIEAGEREPSDVPGLSRRELSFEAVLKKEGRESLLGIIHWSGILTVGDALSPEDVERLLALTETQNHAAIVPVEKFLSADLLEYVEDPRLIDDRLAQALPSEEFLTEFKRILDTSRLAEARDFLLGDLGRTLAARKLWPVQFMTIEQEETEDLGGGWEKVRLTLRAHTRGQP